MEKNLKIILIPIFSLFLFACNTGTSTGGGDAIKFRGTWKGKQGMSSATLDIAIDKKGNIVIGQGEHIFPGGLREDGKVLTVSTPAGEKKLTYENLTGNLVGGGYNI